MHPRACAITVALAAVVLSACTTASPKALPRATPSPERSPSARAASRQTGANVVDLGRRAPPSFTGGALGVWTKRSRLKVWSNPNDAAPRRSIETKNPAGQTIVFLVMAARRDRLGTGWFKVLLPTRPNGAAGWVKAKPMHLTALNQRIVVDLSSRSLEYFKNGRLADRLEVAVGKPATPTPTGTFFVWARVRLGDPAGPYGAFALGLSGFSPVLSEWPGGGRAAIHGTADPLDRGRAISHGCVRVFNGDMGRLEHAPMGTPVIIKR